MVKLKEALVVEGRYDVARLRRLFDTVIVETRGFGIFKDSQKLALLRRLAMERGLVVLTDSDGAGFVIRNYLKGALPRDRVFHAYIPQIKGKERRKSVGSAEGTLGVEGMDEAVILAALEKAGICPQGVDKSLDTVDKRKISRSDFYDLGLTGGENSSLRRGKLLKMLDLPVGLSTTAMLEILNVFYSFEALEKAVETVIREEN